MDIPRRACVLYYRADISLRKGAAEFTGAEKKFREFYHSKVYQQLCGYASIRIRIDNAVAPIIFYESTILTKIAYRDLHGEQQAHIPISLEGAVFKTELARTIADFSGVFL